MYTMPILTHSITYGLGLATALAIMKILEIKDRLEYVESAIDNFPTPEDMAKKILTMKMPVKDLPPEVLNALKEEALATNLNSKGGSYIG